MDRSQIAKKYANWGVGLEIAGLHNPWPKGSPDVKIIQLDLFDKETLMSQYPELNHKHFVDVDILDDANYLNKIQDESYDFLYSSHVLEHLPNVLEGLKNWLRVIRKGGYCIMAIPLKDLPNRVDFNREMTPVHHILTEYITGETNLEEHYREYFNVVDGKTGEELEALVQDSLIKKPHIHFHCWRMGGILDICKLSDALFKAETVYIAPACHEAFVVMKKS